MARRLRLNWYSSDSDHYEYDSLGNRIRVENLLQLTDTAVTLIEPRAAVPGQRINVFGRNFPWPERESAFFLFNGVMAQPLRMSDRVITVEVPAGASSGPLTVFLPGTGVLELGDYDISGIVLTPNPADVGYGESIAFDAEVFGAAGDIVWKVEGVEGGDATVGTIDAAGVYTAPAATSTGEFPFLYRVTAEVAGSTARGQAVVRTGCADTVLISPGEVVSGQFGTASGDFTDCFEFTASEGSVVTLSISANRNMRTALVGPRGRVLVSDIASSRRWQDVALRETGDYRLLTAAIDSNTVSYTLALSDQPSETLPSLALGGSASGSISPFGDVDEHPIELEAGQVVTAYLDWNGGTSSAGISRLRLIDPVTREVLIDGGTGTPSDSRDSDIVDFEVPASGQYILQAIANPVQTNATFSYILSADAGSNRATSEVGSIKR